VECCVESAVTQYKYLRGKDDVNCVNCGLIKVKLESVSQEMKSIQLVINILQEKMNWLKMESRQDVSVGNLENKKIANISTTKFLRLPNIGQHIFLEESYRYNCSQIDFSLFHRAVKPFLYQESLRMVYFSYFHSIMTYGLVYLGNSYHSNTVFKQQKENY
jgi:hypothetical protein